MKFFFNFQVDFWCKPPDHLNLTVEQWLNISAPLFKDEDFDRCSIFNISYTDFTVRPAENTTTIKCNAWNYDSTHYKVNIYSITEMKYITH